MKPKVMFEECEIFLVGYFFSSLCSRKTLSIQEDASNSCKDDSNYFIEHLFFSAALNIRKKFVLLVAEHFPTPFCFDLFSVIYYAQFLIYGGKRGSTYLCEALFEVHVTLGIVTCVRTPPSPLLCVKQ